MTYHTKATPATELRTKERTKEHGEVFTPPDFVNKLLDDLEKNNPECFSDHSKTYIDNSCGNGNILVEILKRKLAVGSSHEDALKTLYGIDIHEDNVEETRQRLLGLTNNTETNRNIVKQNIICHDALTWDYDRWKPIEDANRDKMSEQFELNFD